MYRIGTALLVGLVGAGCAIGPHSTPVMPPFGLAYTHHKAPLQTDLRETDLGDKSGSAKVRYLNIPLLALLPANVQVDIPIPLPLSLDFAWETVATAAAMDDGEITTLTHTDYEVMSILGIYTEVTVHAFGH